MELDRTDQAIIEQLRVDGRRSNVDLAASIGVTEATVRRRLQRLMDEDLVQIMAVTNPRKLGYTLDAAVQIRAQGNRIVEIAEQLAGMPEVRMVACTTGPFDIEAVGMFKSQEELFAFATERVATIPGVESTSTIIYLKVMKRTTDRGAMANQSSL